MAMAGNSVLRMPGHARPGECNTDVLARAPGPAARSVQNARPSGSDEKLAADEAALRPVGQPDHKASVQADVVDRPGQGLATLDGANDLLSPPEARQPGLAYRLERAVQPAVQVAQNIQQQLAAVH